MTQACSGLNRRQFIQVGLVAGTGLVVGLRVPTRPATASQTAAAQHAAAFEPNAWIRIAADDTVTVMVKHTELGQGTTTGSSMIVAEELEADWSRMQPVIAPVAPEYKNPEHGVMSTGGSTGIQTSWEPLRRAGAAVREMLVAAAAATWNVPAGQCRAEQSTVVHAASGRRLRYGELLEKAAAMPVPEAPILKSPAQFTIVGKPFPRLDARAKATGQTRYGIDLKMPGLLTAAVAQAPMLAGRLVSVEEGGAAKQPGVRRVVTLTNAVAVVADTYWQAQQALDGLTIRWEGGYPELNSDTIMAGFAEKVKQKGNRVRDDGDVDEALRTASRRIRAVYELPFQAHACPEPMNCTAHVRADRCDVWAPTQSQEVARDQAARITGLPLDAVFVHTPFVGGGFGRRGMTDYVDQAVRISMAVQAPVKVIWSREEDVQHDMFRPAFYNEIEAGLDKDGHPVAWVHKGAGQSDMDPILDDAVPSVLPKWLPGAIKYPVAGVVATVAKRFVGPKAAMSGSADMAYAITHVRIEYCRGESPVPVCAWRSVADSCNAFVKECFMDEIAVLSGIDPVELRLRLLKNAPREKRVLERAAAAADWGGPLPTGIFRGVALHTFHATPVAMVVEISIEKNDRVKVRRVVAAMDCGVAVNPRLVTAQITGAVAFGLTATLKSAIRIEDGKVRQSNFNDFPLLGFHEMPRVEVHIIDSSEPPAGIGEPGVPPVAPAVANAVFQATGKRIRRLPLDLRRV